MDSCKISAYRFWKTCADFYEKTEKTSLARAKDIHSQAYFSLLLGCWIYFLQHTFSTLRYSKHFIFSSYYKIWLEYS